MFRWEYIQKTIRDALKYFCSFWAVSEALIPFSRHFKNWNVFWSIEISVIIILLAALKGQKSNTWRETLLY